MSLVLHPVIWAFFSSTGHALAQTFRNDALVRDQQRIYSGRAAILDWHRAAAAARPVSAEVQGEWTKVMVQVGGSREICYSFRLHSEQIAELVITRTPQHSRP